MHNNKTRKALRLKYFKQMLNKIIWYQIVNSLKICTLCRLHAATNVPESCIVHAFFFLSFSLFVNDSEKAVCIIRQNMQRLTNRTKSESWPVKILVCVLSELSQNLLTLVEIRNFSQNHVFIRLTKIMNNLEKIAKF